MPRDAPFVKAILNSVRRSLNVRNCLASSHSGTRCYKIDCPVEYLATFCKDSPPTPRGRRVVSIAATHQVSDYDEEAKQMCSTFADGDCHTMTFLVGRCR